MVRDGGSGCSGGAVPVNGIVGKNVDAISVPPRTIAVLLLVGRETKGRYLIRRRNWDTRASARRSRVAIKRGETVM